MYIDPAQSLISMIHLIIMRTKIKYHQYLLNRNLLPVVFFSVPAGTSSMAESMISENTIIEIHV